MFDKYYLKLGSTSHTHTHNVKVKEERAPTDESVKLLNEMQEKAKLNLVRSYAIDSNEIKGTVNIFEEPMHLSMTVYTRFYLNGKEYIIEDKIKDMDMLDHKESIHELFYKTLCNAITKELVNSDALDLHKNLSRLL